MVAHPTTTWLIAGILFTALVSGATGCDPCARGSIFDSEEGLVITQAEHPDGWGRAQCSSCHALDAIHQLGCTPNIHYGQLHERIALEGYDACSSCHGDNGVTL